MLGLPRHTTLKPPRGGVFFGRRKGPSRPPEFQEPHQPHADQNHKETPRVDRFVKFPHRGQAGLNVGCFKAGIERNGVEHHQPEDVQNIDDAAHHAHGFPFRTLWDAVGHHHES